jgi:hypothetical protein
MGLILKCIFENPGWENVDWIYLPEDLDLWWWALAQTIMRVS